MSTIDTTSPRGAAVSFVHREGTTDLSTIFATFSPWGGPPNDEYHLADLYPATFIDIGGHVGTVTVAVLVDNPECRAVVVEPLPENIEVMRENFARNGVSDRVTVLYNAIGTELFQRIGYTLARVPDVPDVHRFVGSPVSADYAGESVDIPTTTLAACFAVLGVDTVDLMKIDCEGCEWVALMDAAIGNVKRIVGEYHGNPGIPGLEALLGKTHDLLTVPHDHGGTGMFEAVLR